MIKPKHRVAILLHEGILGLHGKTGLAMLRYSEATVVAVIERAFPALCRSLPALPRH